MSRPNFDDLQGGGDDNNKDLQYGWRNTRRRMAYKHRGTNSSTPAQIMDQQTYYGYGWVSLVQALHVLQLILLLLASFLRLRWFVDGVGDFMGNYTSSIRSKMQSIKDCVERLVFLLRWILAHGEIALLYAEDLSVYVRRRHRFHPADHKRLDEISEQDCFTWFSQNHANIRCLLLHLRVPDTFTNLSNRAV
jgi:hypothetical protein